MARKQPWSDAWVAALPHAAPAKPEKVFHDPSLSGHRLIVSRTKKTFEVQRKWPKAFGKRTFKVQTGSVPGTTLEAARARGAEVLALSGPAKTRTRARQRPAVPRPPRSPWRWPTTRRNPA